MKFYEGCAVEVEERRGGGRVGVGEQLEEGELVLRW